MRNSLMAGAAVSAFAHLLGMGAAKGARAEDDDDKRDDEARAEDGEGEGDDEDPPKDAKKSKKAKAKAKAEDDEEDDTQAADGDDDADDEDPPKDAKKSKKAKAKAEDDDDEGDDDDSERAKGAKAERARWTRVLSSQAAAGGRLAAACELLSGTGLKASAVISTLNALPASPAGNGLAARMAAVRTPNVGGDGGAGRIDPNSAEGKAAAIVAAGKKRRGEL